MDESLKSLRDRRKERTRAEIVRVAFELFGKHGFDSVPVETICAEAGISRATFFNYFPQKELVLREFGRVRVEKIQEILQGFESQDHTPCFEDLLQLLLSLTEENARLSFNTKELMLNTIVRSGHGSMRPIKEIAVQAIAETIKRIPDKSSSLDPKLAADTLFAIYIATTIEWLLDESLQIGWVMESMEARLRQLLQGLEAQPR